MPDYDLDKLFRPKSIAVVGASPDRPLIGTRTYRNLRRYGYPGTLYPIHPRNESFDGDKCYPSLSALPEVPDFVFVAIPAARTPEMVEECAKLGVKAMEVASGGYSESGTEGAALEARIRETAQKHGIALCGPNNIGFISAHEKIVAWPSPMPGAPKPGGIAVVTQSGSIGIVLCQDERKIGLAYLVSAGNETVLNAGDYLGYFATNPNVRVVLMFLETIRDPAKFAKAADTARAAGKRVVVLKVGRSALGSRAVAAHTGAIAGEDALYDAFFARHGIMVVDELDQMLELAVLLDSYGSAPPNTNVVPVTLSGGEAALLADLSAKHGVELHDLAPETVAALQPHFPAWQTPRNPLDAYGLGWDAARVENILKTLADDKTIGTVAVAFDAPASGGADGAWAELAAEMCTRIKPTAHARIVFFNNSAAGGLHAGAREKLDAAGIPYLAGMGHTFAALGAWTALARPRAKPAKAEPLSASIRARAEKAQGLDEAERFQLMEDAGLPMAPCRAVLSKAEAEKTAVSLGFPVALKGGGPGILHKTEMGLVKLGLRDSAAVGAAYDELAGKVGSEGGVFVQPMIGPGIELILGARIDAGFGPAIVVGLGGTYVEIFKAASLRMAPIGREEAREMLREGALGKILAGARGKGPYDVEAAADAVAALSRFALGTADLFAAIEINPLIVLEKGAFGVDVVLEPRGGRGH
jgi:acyl-CoA synthetase (NDP forming)